MAFRHSGFVIVLVLLPALGLARVPARKAEPDAKPAKTAKPLPLPLPPTPPKPEARPAAAAKPPGPAEDFSKGSVTGLPLPRFAALRADDVNLRAGPGRRYPIEWLYKRRGMPVEIEREFEVWRLVTAPDGMKGWVHEATLVGRRDFIVTGTERTIRDKPAESGRAVAVLKPGVVGRITACVAGATWCKVQVGDYRGWLPRDAFWGALPNETIGPG